ncbi:hypothetical protein ACMFMF_008565 [Clarireedia jacksonii]
MLSIIPAMALLGLAFAAPVIEDTNTNSTVLGRGSYEFYYRFYHNSPSCSHDTASSSTQPTNSQPPAHGGLGTCYTPNIPDGAADAVELDRDANAIILYCSPGCKENDGHYAASGGTCFGPPAGCALGSFKQI